MHTISYNRRRDEKMEIERKFLINHMPENIENYPYHDIEQAYLCTSPVIRIRKEDETYYMTYKGSGMMMREEVNLPLTKDAYHHLKEKADGNVITKRRYKIPLTSPTAKTTDILFTSPLTIELDIFHGAKEGLIMAEVEFSSEGEANNFTPPSWFGEEVTYSSAYHNSNMIFTTQ